MPVPGQRCGELHHWVELIMSGGSELGYGIKAPWRLNISLPRTLYPRSGSPIAQEKSYVKGFGLHGPGLPDIPFLDRIDTWPIAGSRRLSSGSGPARTCRHLEEETGPRVDEHHQLQLQANRASRTGAFPA